MNGNSRALKGFKSLEQVTEKKKKSMNTSSPCVGADGDVKGNSQKAGRYREPFHNHCPSER